MQLLSCSLTAVQCSVLSAQSSVLSPQSSILKADSAFAGESIRFPSDKRLTPWQSSPFGSSSPHDRGLLEKANETKPLALYKSGLITVNSCIHTPGTLQSLTVLPQKVKIITVMWYRVQWCAWSRLLGSLPARENLHILSSSLSISSRIFLRFGARIHKANLYWGIQFTLQVSIFATCSPNKKNFHHPTSSTAWCPLPSL